MKKLLQIVFLLFAFFAKSQTVSWCLDKIKSNSIPYYEYNQRIEHCDLNSDGNIDMAIKGSPTGRWYFYQGNGNGTFVKQDSITASLGDLKFKDVDNDGDPDLFGNGWYAVNIGNFKFSTVVNLSFSSTVHSDISDLNNDGFNDLVTVEQNTLMNIYVNNQVGGFNAPITRTITGAPIGVSDIKITDFDNDGLKDFYLIANQIGILKSTGILLFNGYVPICPSTSSSVELTDINNDGYDDLVSVYEFNSKTLSYYLSNGINLTKNTLNLKVNTASLSSVNIYHSLADLNGDGYIDIVSYYSGVNGPFELITVINNQNSTFKVQNTYKAFSNFIYLDAFDTNNDSEPDVITSHSNPMDKIHIMLNHGQGKFNFPENYMDGGRNSDNHLVEDFDNDFDYDVISLASGKIFILENNNSLNDTSYFDTPQIDSTFSFNTRRLESADLNKDGLKDLIFTSNNRIGVLINNGGLKFKSPVFISIPAMPRAITVNDFNNDSKVDIAVSYDIGTNYFTTLLNNGGLSFTQINTTTPSSSNNSLTSGDYNKDGNIDIVLIENNNIRIFTGLGNGNFTLTNTYSTANLLYHVKTCDLNSDGSLDLLFTATNSNAVVTFFGTGTGTFTGLSSYFMGIQPGWADAADIDSDGKIDIVTTNNSNSYAIIRGLGSNAFGGGQTFYYPEAGCGIIAQDMNGDGTKELVINSERSISIVKNYMPNLNLPSPYTLCSGQSLTLYGPKFSSTTNYTWMPMNQNSDSLVVNTSGNYYLALSNSMLGCSANSNTVTVNIISATPSNITIGGGPRTVCKGDSVKLNVTIPFKPTWNTGDTIPNIVEFPIASSIFQVMAVESK